MGRDAVESYIRMVQHLIEECLVLRMNQEECVQILSKRAKIDPVITSTVWKELEKENKEFFESYAHKMEVRASQAETELTGEMSTDLTSTSSGDLH